MKETMAVRKQWLMCNNNSGMTITEMLIAALMSFIVAGAALDFYVTSHDNWITQENISEMQQSLRVSAQELSANLRNAGASLPEGMSGLTGRNTNPDTVTVRFSATPMTLTVSDHTNNNQAVPIHVERFSSFEGFQVGDQVYIYRPPNGPGEYFTITKLSDNAGGGWKEVEHQGQTLLNDPMAGDAIIKLSEVRYWIDRTTDSLAPRLIREVGGTPQVYAEQVYDLQCRYNKLDSTVTDQPVAGDTIVSVDFSLAAQTIKRTLKLAGAAGRLTRQTGSNVQLRNRPSAG